MAASSQTVADGKVVSLLYTLSDESGEVLDACEREDPLDYLHGAENIVPGLEKHLTGASVGQKMTVTVPCEEAYGPREEIDLQPVPLDSFPEGAEIEIGDHFLTEDEDGEVHAMWVTSIEGDVVMVDFNHPLAGKTLRFEVEVLAIRDANDEELEHGHPHGPDGHAVD